MLDIFNLGAGRDEPPEALETQLQELDDALRDAPRDLDLRRRRVALRLALGQEPGALEDVRMWIEGAPDDPEAHLTRGMILGSLGDPEAAIGAYREALELAPGDPTILAALGLATAEGGDAEEAERLYNLALEADPKSVIALARRAVLRAERPEAREAALDDIEAALRLDDGSAELRFHLGDILALLGRHDEAIAAYDAALADAPEISSIYNNKALVLSNLERTGEALATLDEGLLRCGEDLSLRRHRGELRALAGDLEGALDDLALAAESPLVEEAVGAMLRRAEVYAERDELERALSELDRATSLDGERAELLLLRAELLLRRDGRDPEALTALEKASHLAPKDGRVWVTLARALRQHNLTEASREALDRALALADDRARAEAFIERAHLNSFLGKPRAAERDLARALEEDPEDDDARLLYIRLRATRAVGQRRGQRTFETLRDETDALLRRLGEDARVLTERAVIEDFAGDAVACRNFVERALIADPRYAPGLELRGRKRWMAGKLKEACADLELAVEAEPEFFDAHLNLASVLHELEDDSRALAEINAALAIDAENVEALLQRAVCLFDMGQDEAAFDDLNHAITLAPDEASPFLTRAEAHYDRGDLDAAREDFQRALERDAESADALYGRGWVLVDLDEGLEAVSDFERARALDEQNRLEALELGEASVEPDARILVGLGWAWHTTGSSEKAMEILSEAIALDPYDAEAYVFRGRVLLELGGPENAEAARRDFDAAISLDQDDPAAHTGRGFALLELGQAVRALADFARGIALDPEDGDALVGRGEAYCELGDFERAADDFDAATALDPENIDAHLGRASVWLHDGQAQRAIEDCERALEIDPEHPLAYYRRSLAFFKLGDLDRATSDRDRARDLGLDADELDAGFDF